MFIKVIASQYHPGFYYIQRWKREIGDVELDVLHKDGIWSDTLKMFTENPKDSTGYYPSKQEAEFHLYENSTEEEWAQYIAGKLSQ